MIWKGLISIWLWKHFLTFFNVINGQLWCSVHHSRPCILLVAQCFWNTRALPPWNHLNILRHDDENFKFVKIFNKWSFSYGNDETRTQKLLIPRQKPIGFVIKTWCFPREILYMIHVRARFSTVVFSGVSKPQAK